MDNVKMYYLSSSKFICLFKNVTLCVAFMTCFATDCIGGCSYLIPSFPTMIQITVDSREQVTTVLI